MRTTLLLFFLFTAFTLSAQSVLVERILVSGNEKTKEKVILRELNFQEGDSILLSNMMEQFTQNRLFLMNTGLFGDVKINVKEWDTEQNKLEVTVKVEEALPIYPIPIFELADRNFNVWWKEQNRDLSRINFGMQVSHINLTGRRDRLKITGQLGYTKKLEIEYDLPGINKAKTIGLKLNFLRTLNKEIAYQTANNKLDFERVEDRILQRRLRGSMEFTYRPKLQTYHQLGMFFHRRRIDDFVKDNLNSDYFGNDKNLLNYFSLNYNFIVDKRDIKPYPLTGNYFFGSIKKEGLGITGDRNALSLSSKYAQYFKVSKKWSIETILRANYSFIRSQQPYYDVRALGYFEDYIRGYEYYVIDGIDFFYNKTSLRFELFNGKINFGKLSPIQSLQMMETRAYLTINNDIGYANDPFYGQENSLNQQFLWGKGIGLDLIVYYSLVLQLEYSYNHEREGGVYVHIRVSF